jgi:hypothetical protein
MIVGAVRSDIDVRFRIACPDMVPPPHGPNLMVPFWALARSKLPGWRIDGPDPITFKSWVAALESAGVKSTGH